MSDPTAKVFDRSILERTLTLYGRKPVKEALLNSELDCQALHLADSNRKGGIVSEISDLANARGIPVNWHDKKALSRISKNSKQDQGVALDILCPGFNTLAGYFKTTKSGEKHRLLAVDGITNPQNLGMIIRSATAGNIDGLLLPRKGTAALGPLVIKASVGTIFQAPILTCDELLPALKSCKQNGAAIYVLDAAAQTTLFEHSEAEFAVYVLGNETDGVTKGISDIADKGLSIPMRNNVESLNVAVTASLIAFATYLDR